MNSVTEFFEPDYSRLLEFEMIVRFLVQLALLCASAFFSGSETALFSLTRVDLRQLRREHNPQADTIHRLLGHPRRLIISILCGNEVINIAAAANLTVIIVALYGLEHAAWLSIFVMIPLILLFGEVTPKTIAISNPSFVSSRIIAPPLGVWVFLVTPLYRLVRIISDRCTTWIVGNMRGPDNILQLDELRSLVDRGVSEGELNATERTLIFNLLRAGGTEVGEIMTPRTHIDFIDAELELLKIVERCIELRHVCFPVFRGDRDTIIGFLYATDLVEYVLDEEEQQKRSLEKMLRPPIAVPVTKSVAEMCDLFDAADGSTALLIGEFGETVGMVSLDDVLGFIFGQVYRQIPKLDQYWREDRGMHVFPGQMDLFKFNAISNLGLSDPRMTTLGGFVLRDLGKMAKEGDVIGIEGIDFSVLGVDRNRITEIGLSGRRLAKPLAQEEEAVEAKPFSNQSGKQKAGQGDD